MEYAIENLTKEEAAYIGEKIDEIVPHEVDADAEEFVLKIENENGEIIGGCIAEAYEYHWSRVFLEEPLRRQGLGTYLLKKAEDFAKENGESVIMTSAGDWNAGFFRKNGYLPRGEFRDVPRGHDFYELYKDI